MKSYVSDIFIGRIHVICEVIGLAVLLKIELVPKFISRLQVAIYVGLGWAWTMNISSNINYVAFGE